MRFDDLDLETQERLLSRLRVDQVIDHLHARGWRPAWLGPITRDAVRGATFANFERRGAAGAVEQTAVPLGVTQRQLLVEVLLASATRDGLQLDALMAELGM